jgi:hypothetical protein
MTVERKLPTMVPKRIIRITGMRMAQTRGRKSEWRMWSSSTKGWGNSVNDEYVRVREEVRSGELSSVK